MVRPFIWWMTVFVLGELTVYGQGKRLSILFLGIALLTGCIGFWLTAKREKEENKSARKGKLAMIYFTVCLFFFGMGMERMESFVSQCKLADSIAEDSVWFFAGMIDKIERKNDNFYLYVKHSQIYWEGEYVGEFSVCLQTGEEGWHTGDWIRGNAQNKQWNRARNEGNYNEKNYYRSIGVLLKGELVYGDTVKHVSKFHQFYGRFCRELWNMKKSFCRDINAICDKETAGLYEAILFGEKEHLLSDTKEMYQRSGLAHVICISGIHLTIMGNGCYSLMRKRFGFFLSGGSCFLIMLAYTIMTGMQPSALRAWIMFSIRLFSQMLGRKYDMANSLSIAVLVLLWINPGFYGNAGFWLSILSVLAIGCLAPIWNTFLYIETSLGKGIHTSLVLTLVQVPVLAWNYYQLPLYGMLLNLFVVPCMGLVVGCGILGLVMEQLIEGAGRLGIGLGVYLLQLFEALSRLTFSLPKSEWICGKPEFSHVVWYYLLGTLGFIIIYLLCDKRGECGAAGCKTSIGLHEVFPYKRNANREEEQSAWYVRYGRRAGMAVVVLCCLLILFLEKVPPLEVVYLDVGQGDSIYLQLQGRHYLIDGGSSNVKQVGKYRILPFLKAKGVSRLDGIFISHMDEDHMSGILELLELTAKGEYKIDTLYLTKHDSLRKDYKEIWGLAHRANVKVVYVEKGSVLRGTDFNMTCLYPSSKEIGDDRNTLSQVWHLQYRECSFLFTGDLDEEGERGLMMENRLPQVQVLKVGHHGSKSSSSEAFLKVLSPSFCVISAGVNNRYRHPHQETCQRLREAGAEYAVTKDRGQITVYSRDGMELKYQFINMQ